MHTHTHTHTNTHTHLNTYILLFIKYLLYITRILHHPHGELISLAQNYLVNVMLLHWLLSKWQDTWWWCNMRRNK